MTSPIVHGYPDWGRYTARATKEYLNTAPVAQPGPTMYGPFFVGDVDHLYLFFNPGASARVSLDFFLDDALAIFIDGHTVDCDTNVLFSRPLNVLGPWVRVTVEGAAYPLAYEIKLTMSSAPDQAFGDVPTKSILFNAQGINYAAGFTTLTAPYVIPGDAFWQAMFPARASELRLLALDMLGNTYLLGDLQGNATQPSLRVILPPMTIQMIVANYGVGVAAYWFTLVCRPGAPGS